MRGDGPVFSEDPGRDLGRVAVVVVRLDREAGHHLPVIMQGCQQLDRDDERKPAVGS